MNSVQQVSQVTGIEINHINTSNWDIKSVKCGLQVTVYSIQGILIDTLQRKYDSQYNILNITFYVNTKAFLDHALFYTFGN